MVLQVCRRALNNRQDAEDAFQLTFLVLAKKAHQLQHPQLVGNWLYGVALNVSRRARTAASRRRLAEAQMLQSHTPLRTADPAPDSAHLQHLIDQEIPRLPAKYRAAIVACYIEGKTNRDAARALGWPLGTLVTRLNRAKSTLRARVAARLKKESDAALATALSRRTAPAAVPIALLVATLKAARKINHIRPAPPRAPKPTALRPKPRPSTTTASLSKVQIVGVSAFSMALAVLGTCLALGAIHHPSPATAHTEFHDPAPALHAQTPPTRVTTLTTITPAADARAIATALTQSNRNALTASAPRPRRQ